MAHKNEWEVSLRNRRLDLKRRKLELWQEGKVYDAIERDIHADIDARNMVYFEMVASAEQVIVDTSTQLNPIDISSDSDQDNNTLASRYAQRGSTRRYAKGVKDRAPDSNQSSRSKNKRTLNPEPDMMSRPRRVRHSPPTASTPARDDFPESNTGEEDTRPHDTPVGSRRERLYLPDEQLRRLFRHSLRSRRAKERSYAQILTDPFSFRKLAGKHFKSSAPKMKCHGEDAARAYEDNEIIREFGYRVVDGEGKDVSSEWVAGSNARLAAELEKGREKEKATIFARGREKMSSAPIEFRDANRTNPNDAAAFTVIEVAAPSASIPNAAARIPVADMGAERPATTRGVHANIGGQSEDPDANYTPVVSDLVVDDQAPRHG